MQRQRQDGCMEEGSSGTSPLAPSPANSHGMSSLMATSASMFGWTTWWRLDKHKRKYGRGEDSRENTGDEQREREKHPGMAQRKVLAERKKHLTYNSGDGYTTTGGGGGCRGEQSTHIHQQ